MLHQQMIDKESALIMLGFFIDPEFLHRNVRIPVVLAEIRKFFINVTPDVCAIHYPNLVITTGFVTLKVGKLG
jgi:hypothetical protein